MSDAPPTWCILLRISVEKNTKVAIHVKVANALTFKADILALKYAQELYGVDLAVYTALTRQESKLPLPQVGKVKLFDTRSAPELSAAQIMFVGVQPLHRFGYAEIREFGRKVLSSLSSKDPRVCSVALTIHGPGYGLDEIEAFESELAGVIEAINTDDFPSTLRSVTFVERDPRRAERLSTSLKRLLPSGALEIDGRGALSFLGDGAQNTLRTAGYTSAAKPRVFVAMPFASEMDDVFHYGIQGAANAAGLLCERADLSTFTGDVMEWVKSRISTATLVVADLSTANPNVYLEVGFAWGRNVTTVLLARDVNDLKFNVKAKGASCTSRSNSLKRASDENSENSSSYNRT